MDKKEMHLICNAHIDPMWQWEWEEGACEALSTFRVAAKFCREFDNFIFCHNEALLYMWIEEYEPSLFCEIQELVKLGKWHIMGGWHLQPDCNMPSGEGFVRNIEFGRRYFKEKFGIEPTTAINFDPFGHTRGLVQILAKSGFDSYMFCRPAQDKCPLPANTFRWVGYDGSSVIGARSPEGYNSPRGDAQGKVDKFVKAQIDADMSTHFCLWGVGNHGGGPSHKDISDINARLQEWEAEGVRVIHSTPEDYINAVRESGMDIPEHCGDLNTWAPGCYTSQVRIKQKYRQLENDFFMCEKMCSQLAATTDFAYPEREIGEALYDMLTVQFHDAIPGSSVQGVEEMCIRLIDHGLEILSRLKARAFFKLSANEKRARDGEIPIIVYNPHPYDVEGDFECEFMLADQNWREVFTVGDVYAGEEKLPSQMEKENSNIPIDWRKRVVFHATLSPMQVNRFDCKLYEIERKPVPHLDGDATHYIFNEGGMLVKINKATGHIDTVEIGGKKYLGADALRIDVYRDDEDPWEMNSLGWSDKIDSFKLLDEKEGTKLSSVEATIPSVRIIEDGAVRTVVEAVFGYDTSKAVVRYKLSKSSPRIDVNVRIINSNTKKLYKMVVPCAKDGVKVFSEVAYGEEGAKSDTRECVQQRYTRVEQGSDNSLDVNVYNRGTYAYSVEKNNLLLTLMRAPAYLAHPIWDWKILPQDRHSPYIEQGERLFDFALTFGKEQKSNAIVAQGYNEAPMVLSFFPSGEGNAEKCAPMITLGGDTILMTTFRKSLTCDGAFTVRLFNPTATGASCTFVSEPFGVSEKIEFSPFEIKSFLLKRGELVESALIENL